MVYDKTQSRYYSFKWVGADPLIAVQAIWQFSRTQTILIHTFIDPLDERQHLGISGWYGFNDLDKLFDFVNQYPDYTLEDY